MYKYTHIIYKITFSSHKISIEFNSLTDIYIILNILDFYKKDKSCIIQKINLISNKLGIIWFNDLTNLIKKPIIYLLLKIREEWVDNTLSESHINFSDANCVYTLELKTINEINSYPILTDKISFKKNLIEEILKDI